MVVLDSLVDLEDKNDLEELPLYVYVRVARMMVEIHGGTYGVVRVGGKPGGAAAGKKSKVVAKEKPTPAR